MATQNLKRKKNNNLKDQKRTRASKDPAIITPLSDKQTSNRAEEALQEIEERLRLAFENANIGMCLVDLQGRLTKVNDQMCEIFGYSQEELERMTVNDIAHPEDLNISPTFIQRATSGEIEHTNFEKRYFHKDGHIVWGAVSSSLVRDPQGAPQYFISHVQDITKRKKAEEALKEGERFLTNIFSSIQDGISILDTELNILRVNPAMEQWYSHAMPLIGKKCYKAYHGRTERCEVCPTYQTINTGKGAYKVVPKTGKGGKIVGWLDLFSFPLVDTSTKKMKGVIEYVRDISDRKRAEETLKTTNERLNYLLTSTSVAIYTSKASGDYGATSITENVKQITGYEPREFIKNSSFWIDHIHPEDKQRILNEVLRILEQGSYAYEYRFLCKDGIYRWIRDEVKLVRSEDGKPLEIVGYWIDITEHKQAEETLRQSEEKYRTILENIEDGYYEADIAGNLTFFNDAACRMLGYSKDELMGMNNRQYMDQENAKKLYQVSNKVFKTGEPAKGFDWAIIRKDGTKQFIEASISLINNSSGQPIGYRGVVRDITERKDNEEKMFRQSTLLDGVNKVLIEALTCQTDEEIANKCLNVAQVLTKSKFGFIGEMNQTGRFDTIAMSDPGWGACRIPRSDSVRLINNMKVRGIWANVLKEERSLIVNNPAAHPNRVGTPEGHPPLTSFLGVPLKHMSKTIGMIALANKETGYDSIDQNDIETLCTVFVEALMRKRTEEALNTEKQRFQTLSEQAPFGMVMIGQDGIFKYTNPKFKELFGYDLTDVPNGETWFRKAYPNPAYRHHVIAQWMKDLESFERGEKIPRIFTATCKDGTEKTVNFITVLLETGEYLMACEDITERKQAEENLKESEEKYRLLVEESIQGIVIGQGNPPRLVFANPAMTMILGYTYEELSSLSPKEIESLVHPEDRVFFFKNYKDRLEGKSVPPHYELRGIRKDGTVVWLELSSVRIEYKGQPAVQAAFLDITEHKQAEEAIRQSEERYRTILENIEDGYYEVDLAGNFTFFNDSLCRMLGYPRDEMIGMGNQQYTDEENSKKLFQAFNEVYRTGVPIKGFDWEVIRKDGTKGFGEVSVSLIKDSEGQPIGFRGIARDITKRKQAEEALRTEKQRFQALTENSPFGMVMIDQDGTFKYINPKFRELFGYDLTDIPNGKTWFKKAYPNSTYRHDVIEAWINDLKSSKPGEKRSRIFTVTCKDGTEKIVNFIPVQLETGENLMACEDISERKRAEREMVELQEQLRQSQKMEAIGRLGGGIAHDFNNLLTVIKGYSQLSLLDLKESDPLWGNIQEIQKATQRATDLTRQLLAFSRRQILDLKVLDLNTLLRDLDKMLRRIIGEDIELVALLDGNLGRVKIDPGQIEQVIFNLAVNARDAMPSGGKLTIETANVVLDEEYAHAHVAVIPGRYVKLSVSDTGIGMSQEVREKVFEPFFTTKDKGKGTGLGLSTVYGIVKQSGGNIWVYSEPGHGTTFKIYLPRVEEQLDTFHALDETDYSPGGSETVLLVEDEQEVRLLAHRLLSQQGYRVLEATNGVEALHVAQEHGGEKIHLLLTDVVMPQMGGKELADQLKIFRPDVKVLYTSGYTDDAIVHHGVLEPGTHFLQKPFSLKTLSHKVREVLDR